MRAIIEELALFQQYNILLVQTRSQLRQPHELNMSQTNSVFQTTHNITTSTNTHILLVERIGLRYKPSYNPLGPILIVLTTRSYALTSEATGVANAVWLFRVAKQHSPRQWRLKLRHKTW